MEHRGEADERGTLQDAQEEEWADWGGARCTVCVTANVTLITSAKSRNGSKHLKCVRSYNYTIHS